MNWRPLIPFLFTSAAMVAGVMSLLEAATGNLFASAQLIMLSMILDGLDGQVARSLKATSAFGAELDTFVDIVSFGVAPAFLAWSAALHEYGALGVILVCSIVLSGASRLARFRIVDPQRGQQGYLGLPITVLGGWLAVVVLISESALFQPDWMSLVDGPMATLTWTVTVMFVLLQVSHLRYEKPTKIPILFGASLVAVVCLFLTREIAVAAAVAIAAAMFLYGFVTPFLPKHDVVIEIDSDDDEEPVPVRHG
jgi:CDP-diacylglycerol--serine O-phosphatidyltransferase